MLFCVVVLVFVAEAASLLTPLSQVPGAAYPEWAHYHMVWLNR
jgi:hypothetical protein